jgi:TPR repeat protein
MGFFADRAANRAFNQGDDALGRKDYVRAIELYRKAGAAHADALHRLGYLYMNGFGVDKSLKVAFEFFEKANVMGSLVGNFDLSTQNYYFLGILYRDSWETRKTPLRISSAATLVIA